MGSLFDGSAGFPLASLMNGITPIWASEVEPFPIRVTTKRLPFMKHYGDICKINGAEIEPVDIITGGSPCQDMSVAGKREGLDGKRSVLFRQQIRIVKEMREKTNGKYPRFMVWENVPGALSSNEGKDFRCVLEETAQIKSTGFNVPMPKDKWGTGGLIVDDDNNFSIGWRVLDAQYWGVPQRRRRIFLVADFDGTSAKEILFKREGLSWNFTESRKSWQTATRNIETGIDKAGKPTIYSIDREAMNSGYEFDRAPGIDESGTAYTLKATGPGGVALPTILEMTHADEVIRQHETGVCPTLQARMGTGGNQVPVTLQVRCGCEGGGKGALIQTDQSATLSTQNTQTLFQPKAYGIGSYASNAMRSDNLHSGIYEADTSRTLDLNGGNPACNQGGIAVVTTAYSLQGNMIGRSDKNGPQGSGVNEEVNFTLNATDQHAVCVDQGGGKSGCNITEDVSPTLTCTHGGEPAVCTEVYHCVSELEKSPVLKARDYKDPHIVAFDRAAFNQGENAQYDPQYYEDGTMPTLIANGPGGVCENITGTYQEKTGTLMASGYSKLGTQEAMNDMYVTNNYIVRRLTPLECARLQGFPDWWTANLETENPTKEDIDFWKEVFETHRKVISKATKSKTEKQIVKWLKDPYSDSAEYKMWGNGVALPNVLFVMEGIAEIFNKGDDVNDSTDK